MKSLIFYLLFLLVYFPAFAQKGKIAYLVKESKVQECQNCMTFTGSLYQVDRKLYCPQCVILTRCGIVNNDNNDGNRKRYKAYPFKSKKLYRCKRCKERTRSGYYYKQSREVYCFRCAYITAKNKLAKKRNHLKKKLKIESKSHKTEESTDKHTSQHVAGSTSKHIEKSTPKTTKKSSLSSGDKNIILAILLVGLIACLNSKEKKFSAILKTFLKAICWMIAFLIFVAIKTILFHREKFFG